jgi:hypothetical protein
MTLGPAAFATVLWGAVAVVALVFAYQLYAVGSDLGWLPGDSDPRGR